LKKAEVGSTPCDRRRSIPLETEGNFHGCGAGQVVDSAEEESDDAADSGIAKK